MAINTAMGYINTREDLIEYGLRALGKPVIEINVDSEQLEDRVEEALQIFREYNSDATIRTYFKYQITADDITNKFITVPDELISIVRVLPIGTSGGANKSSVFSIEYQMHLNNLYNLRSPSDLVQFEMTKQHLALIDMTINGMGQVIRFSRHANQLFIDASWSARIAVDDYIVIEGYVTLDPQEYTDVYNDMFLKKLIVILFKKQWGQNMIKFEGVQLPGGVTINGRAIYDDAVNELDKLTVDMQSRFEMPPDFFTG
jgi:hypothetical protein